MEYTLEWSREARQKERERGRGGGREGGREGGRSGGIRGERGRICSASCRLKPRGSLSPGDYQDSAYVTDLTAMGMGMGMRIEIDGCALPTPARVR